MKNYLLEHGPVLMDLGYDIIPIKAGFKHPVGIKNWQSIRADISKVRTWAANGFEGVGVMTRHTPAIDLDIHDQDIVDKLVAFCKEQFGAHLVRIGQAPKTLLVFKTLEPFRKRTSGRYQSPDGHQHRVEVLGAGQQFVAYSIHPDTGRPYEWVGDELLEWQAEDLPELSADDADTLIEYFETLIPVDWDLIRAKSSTLDTPTSEYGGIANATPPLDLTEPQIRLALKDCRDYADDYESWVQFGMALYHQYSGDATGFALWDQWSQISVKYDPADMDVKWNSFEANLLSQRPITFATVLKHAKDARALRLRQRAAETPFSLVHASEVRERLGPIDWQVEGFFEANTTGLVFGDPGSFKSFLALDVALCVAAGIAWHGHEVAQGPVIYIAGEGHGGFARRLAAWELAYKMSVTELPFYFSKAAAQFYDRDVAGQVTDAVKLITENEGRPAMVVLDTLARNFGPGDENSTSDMGVFIEHIETYLREPFGCTVLMIHHSGHSDKRRARGSMALKGGVDFEYRMEKSEQGHRVKLSCTKMKDAVEPEPVWFEPEVLPVGNFDDDITSLVLRKAAAAVAEEPALRGMQADFYNTLVENGGEIDREALRQILDLEGLITTSRQFRQTLHALKTKGLVLEVEDFLKISG